MKWYARPVEMLRRQGSINVQTVRPAAFEVMIGAADVAGLEAPADLEDMTTADVLHLASHALSLAQARIQDLNQKIEVLQQAALDKADGTRDAGPDGRVAEHQPNIAVDLIEIFDHLASRPDDAARRWLENRMGRIARKCELHWIDDTGSVDLSRHEVIGVRPATGGRRPGDIAATVRPGYSQHGRIVRAQQVIAFAEDDGA